MPDFQNVHKFFDNIKYHIANEKAFKMFESIYAEFGNKVGWGRSE